MAAKITNTTKYKIQDLVLQGKNANQIAKELKLDKKIVIDYVESTVHSILKVAQNEMNRVVPVDSVDEPKVEEKNGNSDFTAPPKQKHVPKGHFVMSMPDSQKGDKYVGPKRNVKLGPKTEPHIFRPKD